jgi:hypothetical protein
MRIQAHFIYLNADPVRLHGATPMRIRILVKLYRHKKLDFDMKNMHVINVFKKTYVGTKVILKRLEIRFINYLLILVNFFPPGSGSGSSRAKSVRIRILNTGKNRRNSIIPCTISKVSQAKTN